MLLNADMETLKLEKIQQAEEFFNHIGKKDLRFFGIAGSVSYEPNSADDVDIFIITERGKLWKVLLKSFLARRKVGNESICISLTMDEEFAANLFRKEAEYVVASDAVHVIRLFGATYYENLLSISPFVERYFPNQIKGTVYLPDCVPTWLDSIFNCALFLLLAPYLIIRSLRNSRRLSKVDLEREFKVRIGVGHFYFDSVKYRNLKMKKEGGI